ncbi:hypothetical protein D915_001237 [Fasciola hepatica]|uniref:Uncharacterized protein n=1 Tax=Fasciola hepatica TaxID=6192 RepID=A0A4E0RGM3_FASHE|nr:hypothetical protein D915_001237 [Fasciola hepatica]
MDCPARETTALPEDVKLVEWKFLQEINTDSLSISLEDKTAFETVRSSATITGGYQQIQMPVTRESIVPYKASLHGLFVAPLFILHNSLLQLLGQENGGWNEPVNDPFPLTWEKWKSEVSVTEPLSVPKSIRPANFDVAAPSFYPRKLPSSDTAQ